MVTFLALLALLAAGCGDGTAPTGPAGSETGVPAPNEPLSRSPRVLAARMTEVNADLRRSIDDWLATRTGRRARPPMAIQLRALYQQRAYRRLAHRPRLARATLPLLPPWLRREARAEVRALRDLFRLTPPTNDHRFKTRRPRAPGVLLGYYRKAQRRFRVHWHVLASINLVESVFGRLRNDSSAGAQGPMQFIPSTWRAYGMGGNVHDPHDAILGAANYLRASGAPRSYSRALYAYNNSRLYVRAVLRFSRRMAVDRRSYYALWSWQVFVRTRRGDLRLTGPGRRH
jgi:hypothetical protein